MHFWSHLKGARKVVFTPLCARAVDVEWKCYVFFPLKFTLTLSAALRRGTLCTIFDFFQLMGALSQAYSEQDAEGLPSFMPTRIDELDINTSLLHLFGRLRSCFAEQQWELAVFDMDLRWWKSTLNAIRFVWYFLMFLPHLPLGSLYVGLTHSAGLS